MSKTLTTTSTITMDKSLQRIQAAVVDGRARTPRYIQKTLTILHDALTRSTSSIHQAIVRDTGCSSAEAWFEIHTTLKAVKQHFNSINFRDVLAQEYSLAQGKDNPAKRSAYGCAYIVPAQNSRFYSIVEPVSAAIAAGNCVVVELGKTLLEVESILRKTLLQVMDKDTFAIVEQRPTQDQFFTEQVVVVGVDQTASFSNSRVINSSLRRTIAVVDRSAKIAEAAKHLVRARFRLGGKSPYAPDVVFVNEFAMKEFCQAAVRYLTDELSESVNSNGHSKPQQSGPGNALQKELQNAGTTTLVSGARGSIHLLKQRSNAVLNRKITEPVLVINPITSLDDAIDTANTGSSLLATYYFADPLATKYLSQFITSDVSFTNHIPAQLLVGPAAPQHFPFSLNARYTADMFSIPSPEYISQTADDLALVPILDGVSSTAEINRLKSEIQAALPDMGEPTTTTVGFFEQGIFTGLGIGASTALATVGVCAWYAVPILIRKIRG